MVSCDGCGIVLDQSKLPWSEEYTDEDVSVTHDPNIVSRESQRRAYLNRGPLTGNVVPE